MIIKELQIPFSKCICFLIGAIALTSCSTGPTSSAWSEVSAFDVEMNPSEGLSYLNGELFNGITKKYYKKDTLSELITYRNGKKDGVSKLWFDSGILSYEAYLSKGKLNGTARTWWRNGNLRTETHYKNGVVHGKHKTWYSSGVIFKDQQYKNGTEEGLQKAYRQNGKLFANYEAKNGRIYGLKKSNMCYNLSDENIIYKNSQLSSSGDPNLQL